jgi:hypothetical protein
VGREDVWVGGLGISEGQEDGVVWLRGWLARG